MSEQENILKVQGLAAGYPELTVLENVNLELAKGEVLAVIGQNGSGKSTLLKTLCGLLPKKAGEIKFKGESFSNIAPHQLPSKDISYFAQGGLIMPDLSVREHLELAGSYNGIKITSQHFDKTFNEFPKLRGMQKQRAGNLSGGERQMLSFAILLMQDTGTWLLDEPTAGLAPEMVAFTTDFLKKANLERGITMLLVEHNMDVAFQLASNVVITKKGTLTKKYCREEFHEEKYFTELENRKEYTKEDFLNKFVYN
ncbi:MAG: ATP-binding cassette domain-containing protein [Chitinophagales bacterium]